MQYKTKAVYICFVGSSAAAADYDAYGCVLKDIDHFIGLSNILSHFDNFTKYLVI